MRAHGFSRNIKAQASARRDVCFRLRAPEETFEDALLFLGTYRASLITHTRTLANPLSRSISSSTATAVPGFEYLHAFVQQPDLLPDSEVRHRP